MKDTTEHGGLSLSLSLSLPCSQPQNSTMEKRKKKEKRSAGRSDVISCALTLSTPSCIYNGAARLPQASVPPLPPFPMDEEVADSSDGRRTTLSLELTLSLPSTTTEGESSPSEQVSASSHNTLVRHTEVRMVSDLAPAEDGAEGCDVVLPASERPNRGAPQLERREPWQEAARRLGGTDPLLIQEKRLVATDVSRGHARFLFTEAEGGEGRPKQKEEEPRIKTPRKLLDMLKPAEKEKAAAKGNDGGLPILLLDRQGQEHPGNKLRYWTSSKSYVILGKWSVFVSHSELEAGDDVGVYAFRVPPEGPARTVPMPSSSRSAQEAQTSAAAVPVPAELAVAACPPEERGGGAQGEWRLAVMVCSRVPPEEEERRRRETPEAKEALRQLQKKASSRTQRKRKNPDGPPAVL